MPELAIGVDAARQGNAGLAVGNIVGTNLVNLLLILGLSALISPVTFDTRTLRFELPLMTGASLLLVLIALDGSLGTVDGIVLVLFGAGYTYGVLRSGRRESAPVKAKYDASYAKPARTWVD